MMWTPGNTKPRSANKRITQQKLFNLRRDARTGLYTLTELAVMHKMSYGHVAKLCRSQKVKPAEKSGGAYNLRDRNPAPPTTVEEAIKRLGTDEDFEPRNTKDWYPVSHRPGSLEKIQELRRRADAGMPLWHPHDFAPIGGSGEYAGKDGPGIRVCEVPMSGKGLE